MSIDLLQEKIRKLKNPSMIDFGIQKDQLPAHLLAEEGTYLAAYVRFCRELLQGFRDIVPAVRFDFNTFALLGNDGLVQLRALLAEASEKGFYVLLDGPEIASPWGADRAADQLLGADAQYQCDGLVVSPYIGSDGIKPFANACKEGKDLFVIVRSPNRSAPELQDLLTGTRLVHNAAADMVNRFGETVLGKCGYSRFGALVSATAASSLKQLRSKYNRMFLLVDGLDYPSGNAKNCSYAFDKFGHGAVVCAGPSVTAAWQQGEGNGSGYVTCAVQAAERMKKNVTRYITIL